LSLLVSAFSKLIAARTVETRLIGSTLNRTIYTLLQTIVSADAMFVCMSDSIVATYCGALGGGAISRGLIGLDLCQDVLFAECDDVDGIYGLLLSLVTRCRKCRIDIRGCDVPKVPVSAAQKSFLERIATYLFSTWVSSLGRS
jgi:hypothetical protein